MADNLYITRVSRALASFITGGNINVNRVNRIIVSDIQNTNLYINRVSRILVVRIIDDYTIGWNPKYPKLGR